MKKCPDCLILYEGPDKFCKKCGQKLTNIKSNSFRNFIITIIVIVLITIIGLAVYLIWTNSTGNSLSSLFSNQEQGPETTDGGDMVILTKEELSSDQIRVISFFGHPDQFTVIFDEGNNNERIDTWIYSDMNAFFMFEDGIYNDSEEYFGKEVQQSRYELLPQDFTYGMTPLEVETLIGQKGSESFEEDTGLGALTFGEGEVICIFNPDNQLIIASKQNKLSNET